MSELCLRAQCVGFPSNNSLILALSVLLGPFLILSLAGTLSLPLSLLSLCFLSRIQSISLEGRLLTRFGGCSASHSPFSIYRASSAGLMYFPCLYLSVSLSITIPLMDRWFYHCNVSKNVHSHP